MNSVDLKSRKNKILELIIDRYVDTAMPVSSRAISQKLRNVLSPATIRNVMSDLEEEGFIMHPHTSAGRMPTKKGYRYYVDTLMQVKLLTEDEKRQVDAVFKDKMDELDNLIKKTSKLLSVITNEASIIALPLFKMSSFKQIELVQLSGRKLLAVLITKNGILKNIIIETDEPLKDSDLLRIKKILNTQFNGISLYQIRKSLASQLLLQRDSFFYVLDKAKSIVDSMLANIKENDFCFEGASNILQQPEFNDLDKIAKFLKVMEAPEGLSSFIRRDYEKEGVNIYIDDEIDIDELCGCSIITCNYALTDDFFGTLGIIGPMRMEYSKIISVVNYIADILGDMAD